jgi:hypothetical protein
VSDIDIAVVDSLKALDPKRPIREADMPVRQLRANRRRLPRGDDAIVDRDVCSGWPQARCAYRR